MAGSTDKLGVDMLSPSSPLFSVSHPLAEGSLGPLAEEEGSATSSSFQHKEIEEDVGEEIEPTPRDIEDDGRPQAHLRQRKVYVQTLEGQIVPIDIEESERVEELKMKIHHKDPFLAASTPAFVDRHLYDHTGQELREGRRVLSYDVGEHSTVKLVLGRYPTYADWLQHKTHVPRPLWIALCGIVGSLLIAACAQISFFLPFSDDVPVTGQTFAVLFIPALLGMQLGLLATILYAIEGAMGLPFFASQRGGLAILLGPTGGYLVGFIFAAWVVGWLVEKKGWDRRLVTAFLAMGLGNVTIYLVAIPFLSHFVGWSNVWKDGLLPFIPGDALKVLMATILLPLGWKLRAHRFNVRHSGSSTN